LQTTPHTGELGNIAAAKDRFFQADEYLIVADLRPRDFDVPKLSGLDDLQSSHQAVQPKE
jgi:hypothetical protein